MAADQFTSTHWGVYLPQVQDGRLLGLDPAPWDPEPSPLGRSMPGAVDGPARIRRPSVRQGFLQRGGASRDGRGREPFVEVPWDEALDIAAGEIARVRRDHGPEAIYGGSYGWSSAGRFHHAQSQLNRFLRMGGGYIDSVDSYSLGAAKVILPHVVAGFGELALSHTDWETLAANTTLFVAFGGLPVRNLQVNPGGASEHRGPGHMRAMAAQGTRFVHVGPHRADLTEGEWWPIRPGSDTALMLALAHVLISEGLCDREFLDRCTVGFETLRAYVLGERDGVPKSPAWAAPLTEIKAGAIVDLARAMAASRTMINIAWSLQRAESGEQPYWMGVALAALLGQIGLPGGGFGVGYGGMNSIGAGRNAFSGPRLPQGENPVSRVIPVARIADMLLRPGEPFTYDGGHYTYPEIRLIYWAGGNVFHHHQDINRLIAAWRRPEVAILHETYWTAHARFADIVFPATTTLERDDIGSAAQDRCIVAMRRAIAPVGEARDDYAIFSGLAERLGYGERFTEGRGPDAWLQALYEESRGRAREAGLNLPDFEEFWSTGVVHLPKPNRAAVMLQGFREDPVAHPLATPSGRIELASARIAGFGLTDVPGHPAWVPPREWLGAPLAERFPLHLLSCQPRTRLHSQYDHGAVSRELKIAGREPLAMNPRDADSRGIADGAVVRVFNDRGAFLAGVVVTEDVRPGVVQIATGAWYDPDVPGNIGALCKHGNPNTVTQDVGASSLSQGCAAQSALVEVSDFVGEPPPVTAHEPPPFVAEGSRLVWPRLRPARAQGNAG